MKLPLLGGSGEDRFTDNSSQLTQNWYQHRTTGGKSPFALHPTPGLTEFANVGSGPIRGARKYNDLYFVVSGNELYEINSAGQGTSKGTLNTSVGRVRMSDNGADNGTELIMVDGTNGYIWDSALGTLVEIADAQYPDTATHVDFFDGRFIVNNPAVTGQIAISASYDGTSWDATEVATAERSPDALQGLVVSNRQLWLVGTHTAEKWFNSGAADFPFEPDQSGFSQWGTIAPYSIIEVAGFTFWLSQNDEGAGMIVMTAGGSPQIISKPEINAEIAAMSTITDCYAYTYQKFGHTFVCFQFPIGQKTLCYDILEQEWHHWSSKTLGYHRSSTHTYVFGKHLVGDPVNGRIYQLDWDTHTDNGDTITRIRRSPNIHADDKSVTHNAVMLDIKEGVGDATTTDPQISLRWKDNNGSWSNYHQRSMGKVGEHNKKVVWRKLGRARDRVYEIQVTDPVEAVLIDAYANLELDPREIG